MNPAVSRASPCAPLTTIVTGDAPEPPPADSFHPAFGQLRARPLCAPMPGITGS